MAAFPDLLKRSLNDCNRASKPLAIAVLIVGVVTILITWFLWGAMVASGVAELKNILGPEAGAQIEQQIAAAGTGPQMEPVMTSVIQQISMKFADMPEEQQAQVIGASLGRFFVNIFPLLGGFILFSIIVQLWLKSFFLMVGIRGNKSFGTLAGDALSWMLPLLGLGLLTALIFAVLGVALFLGVMILSALLSAVNDNAASAVSAVVMIAAVLAIVYLAIRLSFSAVILVQDKTGIVQSLKKSYKLTAGKFWKVLGNLVGLAAIIWIVTFVFNFFLSILVMITSNFSPLAFLVGQVSVFVSLLAAAYSTIFIVRFKETLHGKKAA